MAGNGAICGPVFAGVGGQGAPTARGGEELDRAASMEAPLRSGGRDGGSAAVDSVRAYLSRISKVALLTAEGEVRLARRIEVGLYARQRLDAGENVVERGRTGTQLRRDLRWIVRDGQRAKTELVEANLRLVVSLAKRYAGRGVPLLDLIQEGNLGLIHAVEKFDYTKRIIPRQLVDSHAAWRTGRRTEFRENGVIDARSPERRPAACTTLPDSARMTSPSCARLSTRPA
jgi:hypothetical protein